MTNDEMDRLAARIAAELDRVTPAPSPLHPDPAARTPWLPVPVRPEPSAPPGEPPVWAAAAQSLGDLAPIRAPEPSRRRDHPGHATAAIRSAAAGRAPQRTQRGAHSSGTPAMSRPRGGTVNVPVGISNRHVHLSLADTSTLFGSSTLAVHRVLTQPGQFAAEQQVGVVGPSGRIDAVRVVGPARGVTQLEVSRGDAAMLGIAPPVAHSGHLDASIGQVTLVGPNGRVQLTRGVIVPARHLHVSVADGRAWHLADGDTVTVRCGDAARATTWHGVRVRCGEGHATELHLDVDEARAADVAQGAVARIVASAPAAPARRPVITERELLALVSRGEVVPAHAILTPSARDRAAMLGITLTT